MRIRQMDQSSLELKSGRWTVVVMGSLFTLIPVLFIVLSQDLFTSGPGASAPVQGMLWVFLTPAILLVLVIFCVSGFLYTRRYTVLRWDGPSTARFRRPMLFRKQEEHFDLRQVHHLVLHTARSGARNDEGPGSTTLLSTFYAVLTNGQEITIGESRQVGTWGDQPGLKQAQRVSVFIDKDLERTGRT